MYITNSWLLLITIISILMMPGVLEKKLKEFFKGSVYDHVLIGSLKGFCFYATVCIRIQHKVFKRF